MKTPRHVDEWHGERQVGEIHKAVAIQDLRGFSNDTATLSTAMP